MSVRESTPTRLEVDLANGGETGTTPVAPPVNTVAQEAVTEPYLKEIIAAYNAAPYVSQWLDTVYGQNVGNALNVGVVDLLAGKGSPEQLIQAVNDAAKKA